MLSHSHCQNSRPNAAQLTSVLGPPSSQLILGCLLLHREIDTQQKAGVGAINRLFGHQKASGFETFPSPIQFLCLNNVSLFLPSAHLEEDTFLSWGSPLPVSPRNQKQPGFEPLVWNLLTSSEADRKRSSLCLMCLTSQQTAYLWLWSVNFPQKPSSETFPSLFSCQSSQFVFSVGAQPLTPKPSLQPNSINLYCE